MIRTKNRKVYRGPTKFDFMASLFADKVIEFCFKVDAKQSVVDVIKVKVTSVGIRPGGNGAWDIKGNIVEGIGKVEGRFNIETGVGYMSY